MNDKAIYPKIVASIVKDVPAYKIVPKDASAFMRAINVPLHLFNPDFMNDFITTIGATTYAPAKDIADNDWETMAHEGVHARDDQRLGPIFKFLYLFPQCLGPLAVFAALAPVSHWFLLALVFLLFLAPLPAPGRVWAERRGYLMSGCMDALSGTLITSSSYVEWMVDHFCTGQYYWMHWGRTGMRAKILADMMQAQRLVAGTEVLEPYTTAIAVARAADKAAA